jgi:hypothetical protein
VEWFVRWGLTHRQRDFNQVPAIYVFTIYVVTIIGGTHQMF